MTSSLVVQTSFLGDMVLTTPLLAYLAERGAVDVVATPAASAVLANHPAVRDVIVYDKRGTDRGMGGFLRLASRLRASKYDAAYHAQGSARSGALTAAARIGDRVGFATSAGKLFYTSRVAPIDNMHHAARLLSLGTRNPLAPVSRDVLRPRLYPGTKERDAVHALLGMRADDRSLIALAPGSVWATKRWPYYAELARLLSRDYTIVVIGGNADRDAVASIADAIHGEDGTTPFVDAVGKLSLLASAELIRRVALLVTNDSSPLHLASAVNTPTLAVFGPTVPEFGFGPLADISETIGISDLACRPCDRHGPQRCPLGHWKCMRDLSAESMAAAARRIIRDRPTGTVADADR